MLGRLKVWLKKYTKTPVAQSMPRGWSRGVFCFIAICCGNIDLFDLAMSYEVRGTKDERRKTMDDRRRVYDRTQLVSDRYLCSSVRTWL